MNKSFINKSHIGCTVTIIYESKSQVMSKRTIHILGIKDEYVIAYCYLRKGVRRFNQQRILGLNMKKRQEELSL